MPEEAFADMWRSLKDGYSWTALVKNRRKNGDHYWVRANAAPMVRNGALVGYLSVSTKPSQAEVEGAEALYRRFREGCANGLAIHRGLLVRTGLMRWLSVGQLLPTVWRVRLPLLGLAGVLGLAFAFSGLGASAVATTAAIALVSLLLADWAIEAQVTTPLAKIRRSAQQVASGSTADHLGLDRCDDIGLVSQALAQAGLNLQALMADVQEQVAGVQVSSKEIALANNDLSNRTEQTASSLQ